MLRSEVNGLYGMACVVHDEFLIEYTHPRPPVVDFGSSQVPAEIIKELAPGLEFNAEGAPVMPNVGEGMMPNLPGFPAGGPDGQQCCIS